MSVTVRCLACHRVESWDRSPDPVEVEVDLPGGSRRPVGHPVRAAWTTLRAARRDGSSVVGACGACDQPLISDDGEAEAMESWVLETPGGALHVGEAIVGPDGPMTTEETEAWLERELPVVAEGRVGRLASATLALGMSGVVFALWLGSAIVAFAFLWYGIQNGAMAVR